MSEMSFWKAPGAVEHYSHDQLHENNVSHTHHMSDAAMIVELRNENERLVDALRETNIVGNFAYRMQQALDSMAEAQVPEVLREFRSEFGRIEGPS